MPNRIELIASLKEKFKKHTSTTKKYAADLLPQVEKYEWSTEPQYYMEQLIYERSRIPKGRILKSEPTELRQCYKTGYDKNGNVLTEEHWAGHPSNGYTKFFVREAQQMYSYNIDRNGKLDGIEYLEYADDKPFFYGRYGTSGAKRAENYFYIPDGKLDFVETSQDNGYEVQETVYTVEYDSFDAIEKVTRIDAVSSNMPKGQNIVIYRKTAYSIKALTDIFTEEMVNALTSAIKENTQKYAVVVMEGTFSSEEWLPLKLHLTDGNKPLDKNMLLEDFINSENLNYIPLTTPKLENVSELLMQQASFQEKYDLPFKLLVAITKKVKENLNTQNILLIPAHLYDDYTLTLLYLLERVYSKKELKDLLP